MNSINQSIHGLASSLFLNVGLTRIAEKLDPMPKLGATQITSMQSAQSCETCSLPCYFTGEAGQ